MNAHKPFPGATKHDLVPCTNEGACAPNALTYSRIARVAGEAFDADQLGWTCDECHRDEYSCLCEPEEWPAIRSTMALEEAHARIAKAFAPILDLPVTRNADGSAGVLA